MAWSFQVTDMFDAQKLELQDRLRWVTQMLADSALQWYLNLRQSIGKGNADNFKSWEDFLARIRDSFEPPNTEFHLRRNLRQLKQNSSVQEYVFSFRNIVGQIANMSEEDMILNFVEGLKDDIKAELIYRCPPKLDEAIRLAVSFDHAKSSGRRQDLTKQLPVERAPQPEVVETVPMEVSNVENKPRKTPRCYKCKTIGHFANNCHKKKPYRGNFRNNSSRKNESLGVGQVAQVDADESQWDVECLQLGQPKLTVLSVHLAGIKGRALVDSGAAGNFASKTFLQNHAEKLVKFLTKGTGNVEVVDGTVKQIDSMLERIPMECGKFKDLLTVKIIDIKNYDIILGKPWLRKHNPIVDWREDKIEIRKGQEYYALRGESRVAAGNPQLALIANEEDLKNGSGLVILKEIGLNNIKEVNHANDGPLHKLKLEFPEVFTDLNSLPPKRSIEHEISIIPGSKAVSIPPYRISPLEGESLKLELRKMLSKGWIRPSKSPWSAPTLFVKKKDGTLRLCVDYRALNRLTIKDSYPIPRIDDLLDRLSGAKIFSKLDLASGYHQIRVAEKDVEKTAFGSRFGLFEFMVLPFGLMNAPATFMKAMNNMFLDYLDEFIILYLDDILIYSSSADEHWRHLRLVFEKLRDNKFIVKESKCEVFKTSINFLGYVVSQLGVQTDPEKVAAIMNLKPPSNISELRSFLGVVGFYRRFIAGFAAVAEPLSELLKKESTWCWTPRQDTAFRELKRLVSSSPCLKLPNFQLPFIVTCDASEMAVAGVLSQLHGHLDAPIAFESRKTNAHERNYPIHELELLAIVHCLKKWKCYVEGRTIIVRTDHASLRHIRSQKNLSRRMARWVEFLEPLDIKVEYITGSSNIVADGLSRMEVNLIEKSDWPTLLPLFKEGKVPDEERDKIPILEKEVGNFEVSADDIKRIDESGKKIAFVPFVHRMDLVEKVHHSSGHLGPEATLTLVKSRAWWPGLSRNVTEWVKNCFVCQRGSNRSKDVVKSELKPMPIVPPFQRWGIDFIGRLPITQRGNQFIITAKDYGTRWPLAKAVPNQTAKTVAEFIYAEIVTVYGCPSEIVTDQGKSFEDQTLQEYLKLSAVKHLRTTAYHPRTNELVERFNGMLGGMIQKFLDGKRANEWDLYLPEALFACRIHTSRITGASPFYLLYGVTPQIPGDLAAPNICHERITDRELVAWRETMLQKLRQDREEAAQRLREKQEEAKTYYDQQVSSYEAKLGELVMLRNEGRRKFDLHWKGPFRIMEIHKQNAALVKLQSLNNESLPNWINIDRVKPVRRSPRVDNDGYSINNQESEAGSSQGGRMSN